jgi:hypothetical protein
MSPKVYPGGFDFSTEQNHKCTKNPVLTATASWFYGLESSIAMNYNLESNAYVIPIKTRYWTLMAGFFQYFLSPKSVSLHFLNGWFATAISAAYNL